jgi:hypothetical protein
LCRALSVVARDKVRDDGEEVVLELGSVVIVVLFHVCVANHDLAVTEPEDPLEELVRDPAQPIPVGHHDLLDASFERSLQNGEETPPVEVETGRNILNDLVLGITTYEGFFLPDEVRFLLAARDPDVDDLGPFGFARGRRVFAAGLASEFAAHVGEAVEVLAVAAAETEGPDASGLGPLPERVGAHSISRTDLLGGLVGLSASFFFFFFFSLFLFFVVVFVSIHGFLFMFCFHAP